MLSSDPGPPPGVSASWFSIVAAIVATRHRQVRDRREIPRVREENAARPGVASQINASVEGVLRILRAIGKRARTVDRLDATIRQQIAELRRLRKARTAVRQSTTDSEAVLATRDHRSEARLHREPGLVLTGGTPVDEPVALLVRLFIRQDVGDTAPARKRRIRLVFAARREAGIAGILHASRSSAFG